MKVVVTGGSGLVGRHVLKHLLDRHEVVNLDTRPPEEPICTHVSADILDLEAVSRILGGAEAVVHCAAIPGPKRGTAEEIYMVNIRGTETVARAAGSANVSRFVHISSEAVLGLVYSSGRTKPSYFPIDEDHPLSAVEPSGRSKLLAEAALADATPKSMTVVSLRPPWVWVPEEYSRYRTLTERPDQWSDGLWAYIHVDDLAAAVGSALERELPEGFHAVYLAAPDNGTVFRTRQLLERYYPNVPVRGGISDFGSLISSRRASNLIGCEPAMTWRGFLG